MNPLTGGLVAIAALCAAIAGLLWFQLDTAKEQIASLTQQKAQLERTVREKENALSSRARTDDAVRRMAPSDVDDRLR